MVLIEEALRCALRAHAGQTDKAGAPYITHPLRVMARFQDPILQAAALLHDAVEDSEITVSELRSLGFPEKVVGLVDLLTRRDGESYMSFVSRLAADFSALKIKKADLEDNMNISRLTVMTKDDFAQLAKYHKAWRLLSEAEKRFEGAN